MDNLIMHRLEMISAATREFNSAIQEGYYTAEDLQRINYSEMCDWLGWPDLQNEGEYEQAIMLAANNVLWAMGKKPRDISWAYIGHCIPQER